MSKKRIIAIVTIIVLLFAAGISVGVFLYGRGESAAVDGSQVEGTTDGNQVADGNQSTDGTQAGEGNEQTGETENPTTNPDEGNQAEPNDGNVDGDNDETVDNDNVAGNAGNPGNAGNQNVTTDTNVDEVGETTITRVEEQEKLISEAFWDWWQPMKVAVTPTNIGVQIPQITVKKAAITGVGDDQFIYAGQDIIYVIAVTNNGETAVENIEVTDRIPQNTTFVSIEDAVILRNVEGELSSETVGTKTTVGTETIAGVKWVVSIPAGETVIATFTVNVNEDVTGTISNTAIANGEESNGGEPTKTAIIKANKSSEITRNEEEVEVAKIGDLITYTITVENTGDAEGTKFVSAQEGAVVSEAQDSVTWSVTVPAGETVTRTFIVEVVSIDEIIKNIAYVGNTETNTDEIKTIGIKINKTATVMVKNENGELIEKLPNAEGLIEAELGNVIRYKVTVQNLGTSDLKGITVTDTMQEEAIIVDVDASGTVTAFEYDYEVQQSDIDKQQPIYNKALAKIEDTESEAETETPVEKERKEVEIEKQVKGETESVDLTAVKENDVLVYSVKVTNKGNTTISSVTLTDEMLGITEKQYTFTPIKPGETTTIELGKYTVKLEDINAQTPIKNVVTVNGKTDDIETPVIKKYSYTVEYYYEHSEGTIPFEGKLFVNDSSKTEEFSEVYGKKISEYTDNKISGYELLKAVTTDSDGKLPLVVTEVSENNVIKVYYIKKTYNYKVEHYIQNLDGTWPATPKDTDTITNVTFGEKAKYDTNSYIGFTYDATRTVNGNATVPDNNNLVIKLYYTRNQYNYVVNYLEHGTNEVLHTQKVVNNIPFGTDITSANEVIAITGYNYHSVDKTTLTIGAGNNAINIYYTENVRTATVEEKSSSIRKTNLVIVLDLSSSMASGTSRLEDAKTAAEDFIDQIYTDESISGVNIKVVTFNKKNPVVSAHRCDNWEHYQYDKEWNAYHKLNEDGTVYGGCIQVDGTWYSSYTTVAYSGTQVLSTTLTDNTATNYTEAQTLKTAISNIYIPSEYEYNGFGTHIYAALQEANTQITSLKSTYSDNDNVVVFIGDGKPTPETTNGYSDNTDENIISAATTLKGNATVYCIRLGNEAQNSTVFDDIATLPLADHIVDADTEGDLIEGFEAITSKENDPNYEYPESSKGVITIKANLDTTKSITVTKPDGTSGTYNSITELNASGFISYDTTSKTFTWNVLNYPNNVQLNISYTVK